LLWPLRCIALTSRPTKSFLRHKIGQDPRTCLPPPGKIEVLAVDVDAFGRRYATKWMDSRGVISTKWRLLVKVEKAKKK
jgi:hypothetical protein